MRGDHRVWRRVLLRDCVVVAAAAGFLTISGAFLGEATVVQRLGYWLLVLMLGVGWGEVCGRLVGRVIDLDDRPWLGVVVMTLAVAAPMSATVWAVTGPALGYPPFPLRALPGFFGPVVAVSAVMTVISLLLRRPPVQTHAAPAGQPAVRARFPDRLPARQRGAAIRAVQSEDHYLRVHTDRGSDLILMRLSDALEELEGLEGAQTHRSWWVARDAVRDVERGDGRAVLTLDGGLVAPVSRRYARALREAGWY
ncbi:MAG: LytTR family transcriptional regulator [Brevundimonas sp.]|nr:MAG: LytTR family transcriptional regulator [Brevundimonas sp.]